MDVVDRSVIITAPTSQGLALQQRTGRSVKALRSQYIAREVNVPTLKSTSQDHKPIPLQQALPPLSNHIADTSNFRTLDGFILLEMTGMGFPDDARKANISNSRLNEVVMEDLSFFTGLMFVDASENFLDLAPFGILPRLKDMKLCCNNIEHIHNLQGFERLQTLDLSYNKLTLDSVQALGKSLCLIHYHCLSYVYNSARFPCCILPLQTLDALPNLRELD